MAKYLLVAHQTAEAPELIDAARELAAEDAEADFTLLVPATPVGDLMTWEEGEAKEVARDRAESASAALRSNGVNVVDVRVGDADPALAIGDEFLDGRRYQAVIISTLAPGISRWIKMDAVSKVRRQHPKLRVIHVVPKEQ